MKKTCTKCKKEKDISDFPRKNSHGKMIHGSHCKVCKNARRIQLAKEQAEKKEMEKEFVFDPTLTGWIVNAVSGLSLQKIESLRNTRGNTPQRMLVMWDEMEHDGADCAAVCQANQQRGSVQISERMV